MAADGATRACPACGGANDPAAVFCARPECHKALGEFAFVNEELAKRSTRLERAADRVARFTAHPNFITLHLAWFGAWILLNSGLVAAVAVFDSYPYSLLGILLAVEAILITGFLLISQARQGRHAETRAELDYEVNVRSWRRLAEIGTRLDQLQADLDALRRAQ
jgi:uncharacterized membrane protein